MFVSENSTSRNDAPERSSALNEPLTILRGVGPSIAARLERLGLTTVQDLLFHLPYRYEDRTRVVPIGQLQPGDRCVVDGEVLLSQVVYRGRRMLLCNLADGTGHLTLRFFYFNRQQQSQLARGAHIRCFGEARSGPKGMEIVHPEYRILPEGECPALDQRLTPIYPTTDGLSQPKLRNLVDQALSLAAKNPLRDWLPAAEMESQALPGLNASVKLLHRPPPQVALAELGAGRHPAQRRLAFEEMLAHHLSLRRLRESLRRETALQLSIDGQLHARFLATLPFKLTGAQSRVLDEIEQDLAKTSPMLRLVQGDVGSGKTVVAAASALAAVETGAQVALMAPTELLAEQHYKNFSRWFDVLGVRVGWLTGKLSAAERRQILAEIAAGSVDCVIGTHALFQEQVEFSRLALLIVDEQHRFGVHQRLSLREKGIGDGLCPHQLVMTATPIPRTLAMTAYADLDASAIDELPPGRQPIATVVVSDKRRDEVIERVRRACTRGQQAYWVCPLIEESETLRAQAAEETATMLAKTLPHLVIGLVHGRLKPDKKEQVMRRFKDGSIQLLVATTVIEVGVDVPNASLMIVENAERMGLAQLHQLRGRVGRGDAESACVLMYHPPLSQNARARLRVLKETNDGFEVSRKDLELRGPGEVLGTRQTGMLQMRIADLMRDADLIPVIQRVAGQLFAKYPGNIAPLIRRWIGGRASFGKV